MDVTRTERIERTARHVRAHMRGDSSGHDWWHVDRVRRMAVGLAEREHADLYIVEMAALLHDISDYKLNGGDHDRGPLIAARWVSDLGETEATAATVAAIIASMSFAGAGAAPRALSLEGQVVQDADRLDAIGAIGVARAFAFGGHAGEVMHDPGRPAQPHATAQAYFNRDSTTINHFREKLLLLKDRMNTASARRIADRRHEFLETFLAEFLAEWEARDVSGVAEPGG